MSNLIKASQTKAPAFLRNAGMQTMEEFAGGIVQGLPLPVLSIRGKVFRVRKDGLEISLKKNELQVVLVAARQAISKRFFKGPYESGGDIVAPACMSVDGITPDVDVSDPVSDKCTTCPNNAWGSRLTQSGKKGKKCADYKRLVIWVVGLDTPFILDLPASSLRAPKAERGQGYMMFADYIGQLAKHQMDPPNVVTTIGFTEAEYPQVWMNFDRYVSEDEFKLVQQMRAMPEVEEVLHQAVVEGDVETKEEPAPEPEEPKAKAKAKAKPKKEEPAPESEKDDSGEDETEDVLNDLRALLG